MHHSSDTTHISQRLETGRKYLEALADIASQLENAKDGLVSSSYLNDNLDDLPTPLRRLWESLDQDVTTLSQKDLLLELAQLERLLTVRLTALMPIINAICSADERGHEIEPINAREQFAELARLANTSLAIRLLAKRRHYEVPPAELPINSGDLRERAQRVKTVERKHKLRVLTQMKDMVNATTTMLNAEGLDSGMRTMLKSVLRDLQSNAKHLAKGGSFGTLPVPIEHVEMHDESPTTENVELALVEDVSNDTAAPKPSEPVRPTATPTITATSQVPTAVSNPNELPTAKAISGKSHNSRPKPIVPPKPKNSPLRLWRHLRVWMKAPIGVTWREAEAILRASENKNASLSQAQDRGVRKG